jgi:hypothetical protein
VAKKSLLIFVPMVLLPIVAWAQPADEEAVRYYQVLKKTPAAMESSSLTFGETLREAIALGNADSIAQMKIALTDVLLTLNRIKAETGALKVESSPSGLELYGAVENYLKQQEKTVVESGPEFIRIAADSALSAEDKRNRIQTIIERNRKGAAAVDAPFTRALMAFAREHDLAGEPTVEMRAFVPPDKSCKVLMPDLTENKTSVADGLTNTYYLAEHKNGVFMLSYADIAPAGEEAPALQRRLDEARTGVLSKLNMSLTKESALSLADKHPGRELEGALPDKTITRIRLFLVNGRLYQLWIVGKPAWAVSAEASRFLLSFELLN